jgi:hypothetical protein
MDLDFNGQNGFVFISGDDDFAVDNTAEFGV